MKKYKTEQCTIYRVLSGPANAYVIAAPQCSILVDTGQKLQYAALKRSMGSLKRGQGSLLYMIVTHAHYDHCQNAARIKKETGCSIVASKNEKECMEQGKSPFPRGTAPFSRMIVTLAERSRSKRAGFEPFSPDITVDQECRLPNTGADIQVIATPGHSAGSVSVIVDKDTAIVGDTMFGIFPHTVYPPFADDTRGMVESWKKLLNTECRRFLPGHGMAVSRRMLGKEYRKYCTPLT